MEKKNWVQSKYVYRNGKLRASTDPKEVSVGSRLIANITADFYGIYLKEYCKGDLIDLGCGKAPLYGTYIELVDSAICVDWPNASHGKDYLDFECDLTKELPFGNEAFDTIILSDVLEHIPTPELLWREMHRILKPGGRVIMNVPFFYWLHEAPYDYYRYTEFGLQYLAETTGFEVKLLKSIGGIPEVITDILVKFIQFRPLIGKPLALSIQNITSLFLQTRLGKALSTRTSSGWPLGYFMVAERL